MYISHKLLELYPTLGGTIDHVLPRKSFVEEGESGRGRFLMEPAV